MKIIGKAVMSLFGYGYSYKQVVLYRLATTAVLAGLVMAFA